jgi:hypothetical protein
MSSIKNISLYIPHIFANYSKEDVIQVFEDQNIGEIKNIDFVSKIGHDGNQFNAAYIHFNHWYDNIDSANFQERVINPNKEARLMYDKPWFWIVLENKARKFISGDRKPRIDLSDFPTISPATSPIKVEQCPGAPVKTKINNQPIEVSTPIKLENSFENEMREIEEQCEIDIAMDEMEAEIEKEDKYLVCFDSRYVKNLEEDNNNLTLEVIYYRSLLLAEQIKTQTYIDVIKMIQK